VGVGGYGDGDPAVLELRGAGRGAATGGGEGQTIHAAIGAVRAGAVAAVALALRHVTVDGVIHQEGTERGGDRLDLRQLDALTAAGLVAVAERGEDGDHR